MIRIILALSAVFAQAQLAVTLSDGSRIVGQTANDKLAIHTNYGDLLIPLGRLLEMTGGEGRFVIRLRGGDRLSGELRTPRLHLATRFGELDIPAAEIRQIRPSYLSGVVAWWSANGDAQDHWASHHGEGNYVLVADRHGRPNSAFGFVEASDGITVADHSRLDTQEQFSLAAWILPRAYGGYNNFNSFIVSKWFSRQQFGNYLFGLGLQGELRFVLASTEAGYSEEQLLSPADSIPIGKWTHVAATFDRGQAALYIDGHVAVRAYFGEMQRTEPKEYSHDEITIGGFWTKNYDFRGAIDDVMLFNRALSPAEIASLADAPDESLSERLDSKRRDQ